MCNMKTVLINYHKMGFLNVITLNSPAGGQIKATVVEKPINVDLPRSSIAGPRYYDVVPDVIVGLYVRHLSLLIYIEHKAKRKQESH